MDGSEGGFGPPSSCASLGRIVNNNEHNCNENVTSCNNFMTNIAMNIDNVVSQGVLDNNSSSVKKRPVVKYNYKNIGPFEVYVESKEKDKNLGNLHILSLAKMVFNLNNNEIQKINRKGKNRIGVVFRNFKSANDFVDFFQNNNQFNVFIPYNKVTCKGVIKYVDLNFSEEEILEYSQCNINSSEILEVRRIKRKNVGVDGTNSYIPTSTVCILFSGVSIPREIFICGLSFPVYPYLLPVVQCFNCLLYGHTKKLCRGKKKCRKCGTLEQESHVQCEICCFHCKSPDHDGTNRVCPEFVRQKRIKELMSFENKSFFEANELTPSIYKKNQNNSPVTFQIKDFPQLNNNSPQSNTYHVHERRDVYRKYNPNSSYSSVLGNSKKRKTDSNRLGGWNREEQNNFLINPNGRLPNVSSVLSQYSNPSQILLSGENSRPLQREDVNNKALQDIIAVASILPLNERSKVLNFMTQLTSISASCSNDLTLDEPGSPRC